MTSYRNCFSADRRTNIVWSLWKTAWHYVGFPGGSVVKNPPANAGDVDSIPELGRSPGEGNGNPLQHSCPGNPMARESGGLQSIGSQKCQTQLRD